MCSIFLNLNCGINLLCASWPFKSAHETMLETAASRSTVCHLRACIASYLIRFPHAKTTPPAVIAGISLRLVCPPHFAAASCNTAPYRRCYGETDRLMMLALGPRAVWSAWRKLHLAPAKQYCREEPSQIPWGINLRFVQTLGQEPRGAIVQGCRCCVSFAKAPVGNPTEHVLPISLLHVA